MTFPRRLVLGLPLAAMLAGGCADDAPPTASEAAVTILATGCSAVPTRGAGLVVGRGVVLTAAHVVAGASSIEVHRGGHAYEARVVAFDPTDDVAALEVPFAAGAFPVAATSGGAEGARGSVVVGHGGAAREIPVELLRKVTIRTEDVFGGRIVERPGYELQADIEAGDSGGVVVVDGVAVAVVWAKSRLTDGRAWAVDAAAVWPGLVAQIAAGPLADDVGAGRCP